MNAKSKTNNERKILDFSNMVLVKMFVGITTHDKQIVHMLKNKEYTPIRLRKIPIDIRLEDLSFINNVDKLLFQDLTQCYEEYTILQGLISEYNKKVETKNIATKEEIESILKEIWDKRDYAYNHWNEVLGKFQMYIISNYTQ